MFPNILNYTFSNKNMFNPNGTGGFQRGLPGLGMPPFNPGVPGMRMGEDNTTWQSNQRVYYPYTCLPLINIASNSLYLEKNYVFAWDTDDTTGLSSESPETIFNQYMRQGLMVDNVKYNGATDMGPSNIPIIIALNLPMLNYHLMKMCNSVVPAEIDKKYSGSRDLEPWLIPPVEHVVARVWPIGPNVTTKEAAEFGYTTRNIAHTGMSDTRHLWAACDWDGTRNNKFQMVPTGARVGFMCYPELATKYKNPEIFHYQIDEEVVVSQHNTKEVFWKVVPVICGDDEHMKSLEAKYTIVKNFCIDSTEVIDGEIDITGEKIYHDKTLVTLTYRPYIWRVGKLGGPAAGPMNNATGTTLDNFYLSNDPAMDYNTLVRLPVFELHADILGPPYKSHNFSFNRRKPLKVDDMKFNRYHHHLLLDL